MKWIRVMGASLGAMFGLALADVWIDAVTKNGRK